MGIQGLLPFLEKAIEADVSIKNLKGKTAAIDTYCWLHTGAYWCGDQIYRKEPTDVYVKYCMSFAQMLVEKGIKPILVFDGLGLPAKKATQDARRESREERRLKVEKLLKAGKTKEATALMKSCITVTPEMAREVIAGCRKNNYDYVVAPYEADAQLAYLVNQGLADFVITIDSDLVLFGCQQILYKLNKTTERGSLFKQDKIGLCLEPESHKFDFFKFRRMCILSGCDYLASLPSIGLKKSFKFFSITDEDDLNICLKMLPSYLNMKDLKVTPEYIKGFIEAENTFKHQLVFCPIQRKCVPLNPYEVGFDSSHYPYAGELLEDGFALQLALGNVDLKSKEIIDNYDPVNCKPTQGNFLTAHAKRTSIWSKTTVNRAVSLEGTFVIAPSSSPKVVSKRGKKRGSSERLADDLKKLRTVNPFNVAAYSLPSDTDLLSMYSAKDEKSDSSLEDVEHQEKQDSEIEVLVENDDQDSLHKLNSSLFHSSESRNMFRSQSKLVLKETSVYRTSRSSRYFSDSQSTKSSQGSDTASSSSLLSAASSSSKSLLEQDLIENDVPTDSSQGMQSQPQTRSMRSKLAQFKFNSQ